MKYRSMKDIPTPAHRYKPTYTEALAVRTLGGVWMKNATSLNGMAHATTDSDLLRQLYQDGHTLYHKAVETIQKEHNDNTAAGRKSNCPQILIPKPDKVSQ